MRPNETYENRLRDSVRTCDKIILIHSANLFQETIPIDFVGIASEINNPKDKLIVVLTDQAKFHGQARLVADLSNGFEAGISGLLASLTTNEREEKNVPRIDVIDALIMKGGGVKGIALAGAFLELERYYKFRSFVGTSAGSIVAALLAAGWSGRDLKEDIRGLSSHKFLDGSWVFAPFRLVFHKGVHPGVALRDWLKERLESKLHNANIQMRDLPKRAVLFATKENDGPFVFDSTGAHDDSTVHTAVRCSTAIPIWFYPEKFDGHSIWDGGLCNNYPVAAFIELEKKKHSEEYMPSFIAIYLGEKVDRLVKKKSYILSVIETTINRDEAQVVERYKNDTIFIETSPIQSFDFALSEDEKNYLFLVGQIGALRFLDQRGKLSLDGWREHAALVASAARLRYQITEQRNKPRRRVRMFFFLTVLTTFLVLAEQYVTGWPLLRILR